MPDILFMLLGAALGGVGTWLWASRYMRDQLQEELAHSSRKSARAIEWVKSEAAMQLERRDQEIAALRATLDEHQHDVEKAKSRLQADLMLAQRERAQFETRSTGLSQTSDELRARLRAVTTEGLHDLQRLNVIADSLEGVVADFGSVIETMDARLRAAAGQVENDPGSQLPTARPRRGPQTKAWTRNGSA